MLYLITYRNLLYSYLTYTICDLQDGSPLCIKEKVVRPLEEGVTWDVCLPIISSNFIDGFTQVQSISPEILGC